MTKLIIFGTGKIAEVVSYFFNRDSEYEICAYVCDQDYITENTFLDKPVIASEIVQQHYSSDLYKVFVAIGYQGLNSIRTDKVTLLKKMGYKLVNYLSPNIKADITIGENSIIMDDVSIQPSVTIGDNTFIWGGAMVGHHTIIEDNCWITGSSSIGGLSKIGKNTFIGLNATIGNEITIGEDSMLGAGTLCCQNLPASSVLVEANTPIHRLNSQQFVKLSSCFRT